MLNSRPATAFQFMCIHFFRFKFVFLWVLLLSAFSSYAGPQLRVYLNGTNLVLAWPTNAVGFQLQSRASLTNAESWNNLGATSSVANAEQQLVLTRTNAQQFYRLFKESGTNPAVSGLIVSPNAVAIGSTASLEFEIIEPDLDLAGFTLSWTNVLGSFTNILSAKSIGLTELSSHVEFPIRPEKLPIGTSYFTLWLVDRAGLYSAPVSFEISIVGTGGPGAAPQLFSVTPKASAWQPAADITWKLSPGFELNWSDAESDVERIRATLQMPSGEMLVKELLATRAGFTNASGTNTLRPFTLNYTAWTGTYLAEFQLFDRTGRTSAVHSVQFDLDFSAPGSARITGFSPSSGPPGTLAHLFLANASSLGTNFQLTLAGVPCPILTNEIGNLSFLIPTGAVTSPFKLITSALTVSSSDFVVSPFLSLTADREAAAPGEPIQFSTFIRSAANHLVTFSVNGIPGGNTNLGFISTNGLYQLPLLPPTNFMKVTAALTMQPSISSTLSVQVLPRVSLGGSNWISSVQGGSVSTTDGAASLDVPPGALPSNTLISISRVSGTNIPPAAPGRRLLGGVRLGPDGIVFNQPVTITLPLAERRPPGTVIALKYFIRATGTFVDEGLTATVAANGREAVGQISHFSEVMGDEVEVVTASGPPQITSVQAATTFQEGLIVPVLINGQNLVPGLRVEVLSNGQPTSDVIPSSAIFETNRMGVLLAIATLRDLDWGASREYELRVVNSGNQSASTNLLVQGLNELSIGPGVQTNFTSSLQTFSEVDIGVGAVVTASGLGWFVNGPVRVAGRIDSRGSDGQAARENGPGTNRFFTDFTQRGANGGDPDLPGHDAFLQLSARGDFQYGQGGSPGEDISSIETFFEALFNLWNCVTGSVISCGEFVASVVEIIGDFADMEAGKAIGRPGLPGARAAFDSLASSGRGGGGGGGGGDLNWFDEGEFGGAGGGGGNGVFILTRGDMLIEGVVDARGGDGGDGGENIVTVFENAGTPIPIEETPSANRGGGGGGGSGGSISLLARGGYRAGSTSSIDARGGNPGNSLTKFRTMDASTRTVTAERSVRFVDAKYPVTPSGWLQTEGLPVPARDLPDLVTDHGLVRLQLPPAVSTFSSLVTITVRGENTNQMRQVAFTADGSGIRRANVLFYPGFNTVWINDGKVPDHPMLYRLALYLAGPDSDGDELSDTDEALLGTNPLAADTDGDGLSDLNEVLQNLNPNTGDTDGDLITDPDELAGGTDPRNRDTDGDGFWDGWELQAGRSPLNAQPTIGVIPPGTLFAEVGSSVNGRVLGIVDPVTGKMFGLGRVNSGLCFGLAFNSTGTLLASRGNQLVRILLDQPANASGQLAVTNIGNLSTNGPAIYSYSLASSLPNGKLLGIESTALGDSTGQFLEIDPTTGLATRVGLVQANPLRALAVFGAGSTQEVLFASSAQPAAADALLAFPSGISNAAVSLGSLNWTNVNGLTPASPNRLYAARTGEGKSQLVLINTTNSTTTFLPELAGSVFDLALSPCPAPCLNGPFFSSLAYPGEQMETADFNGDTHPDLAVTVTRTIGPDQFIGVSILHGQGNGTFTNAASYFFANPRDLSAPDLALADVNGDGRKDIILMQPALIVGFFQTLIRPAELMVLLADTQGGFQSPIIQAMSPGPSERLSRITAADWSGDGLADLSFVNESQHTYSFQGTGTGLFTNAVELVPGAIMEGVLLTDVNADGKPDFLGSRSGSLDVRLADGAGGFLANQHVAAGGRHINVGDVDGDNDLDVVTTDYGAVPTVFYNTGTGSFPTNASFNPRNFPNGVYARAGLGDFSGDGRADAIVPSVGQTITAFISGQAPVTFAHTMVEPVSAPFGCGGTASGVLVMDVNKDGFSDVVVLIGSGISVLLGEPPF